MSLNLIHSFPILTNHMHDSCLCILVLGNTHKLNWLHNMYGDGYITRFSDSLLDVTVTPFLFLLKVYSNRSCFPSFFVFMVLDLGLCHFNRRALVVSL